MRTQRMVEAVLAAVGLVLMALGVVAHERALANRASAGTTRQAASVDQTAVPSTRFAIVGARVFDGVSVIERATVLVEAGRIRDVGPDVAVPPGVPTVDGSGRTLLPGLIDAHTHAFGDALERALVFGVTTELDMFTDARWAAERRDEQRRGVVATRADLYSSGTLATAPGGHGTEYGLVVPTLRRPEEAQAFVDARVAEGSDYIKIIHDDLAGYGTRRPSLDLPTITALIDAAHRRQKLAVVHVTTCRAAREAIAAGADVLAHAFADREADADLASLASSRRVVVIPTMTVLASSARATGEARALASDAALAPYVSAGDRRSLQAEFPSGGASTARLETARQVVGAWRAAGVPLLAGTDAPNPGTAHGVSLHHELALLVSAGLTPAEALAAATSRPARVFHLDDRGRIAPGLRADLVLVAGDPTREIAATRRIVAIWKGGVNVTRPPAPRETPAATVDTDGLVCDFESGTTTAFGSGWTISTDKLMGGASEAVMRVVPGGAERSAHSLEVTGSVRPGGMYPWAGPMFFPGPQPMAAVDLARFKELVFWTRGDGGTYKVMLFATRLGNIPAERPFVAGPEWTQVVMPIASFGSGLDARDLRGVLFSASAGPSGFRLQIDNVRFR